MRKLDAVCPVAKDEEEDDDIVAAAAVEEEEEEGGGGGGGEEVEEEAEDEEEEEKKEEVIPEHGDDVDACVQQTSIATKEHPLTMHTSPGIKNLPLLSVNSKLLPAPWNL